MTKKIYQPDKDTPYEAPADTWREPPDGSEVGTRSCGG